MDKFNLGVKCENHHCSGFSNEDLPSDYLGYIAYAFLGGWSLERVVKDKFGGGFGREDLPNEYLGTTEDAVSCSIFGICGSDNPYNGCWNYKQLDPNGNYSLVEWPSSLYYELINQGKYWFTRN